MVVSEHTCFLAGYETMKAVINDTPEAPSIADECQYR